MGEAFIQNIDIKNYRVLTNDKIKIGNTMNHIIVTGKNGSGKTTLLNGLWKYLKCLKDKEYINVVNLIDDIEICNDQLNFLRNEEILTEFSKGEIINLKKQILYYNEKLEKYCNVVKLEFANNEGLQEKYNEGKFILEFYENRRDTKIEFIEGRNEKIDDFFIFLRELKDREEEAIIIEDDDELIKISKWYKMITRIFQIIIDDKSLKITFEKDGIKIKEKFREEYGLEELSDGHSAIIKIILELIIRMERVEAWKYDLPGVVVIDGVDKYLDTESLEKIIPLLNTQFSKVQFILSSRFNNVVKNINSVKVYDLDKL